MTVTTTATRVSYIGNGATTTFSYTFPIPDQDYLVVIVVEDATGTETTISAGQYSVTGIGEDAGGIVTYPLSGSPLSTDYTIVILREVPFTQETDFTNQSAFYAEVLENALDVIVMEIQQINTDQSRTLMLTPGSTDGSGAYDANGNRIINLGDPIDNDDAVNKTYVDTIMVAAGNVPSPVLGEVGYYLKATATGVFGWASFSAAGYLTIANNLSDLASAGTARTNLGLGGLAVKTTVATADIDALAVTTAKIAASAVTIAKISATGSPSASNFLRGDGSWASSAGTVTSVATGAGLSGGTITTTGTITLNTNNSLGVGAYALLQVQSGSIADGGLVAGASTLTVYLDSSLVMQAYTAPSGTWRNVSGRVLGAMEGGLFVRTA